MNAPHTDGPEIPRSDIEDETAVRAYERWVARGRPNGTQLQDWIEAEVEVRRLKDLAQRSREADTPLCDSIAESGRGENELWISGEVGHRLFDSVPDAIVVVRRDGRIVAVNAQAQVMFGYKREEMLGRPVEMLLPRRFQDRHVASRDGYFSAPGICLLGDRKLDLWGRRRDGGEFPVDIGLSPLKIQDDTLAIGVIRDITERKRAERRLAAEHEISHILAASDTLNDAAPSIIQALCESLNWGAGTLWVVDRNAQLLRCVEVWHTPTVDAATFEQVCRQNTFSPGMGLPGLVWSNGTLVWIHDVEQDANIRRALIATKEGLHEAIGFPIRMGNEFLGVMEFFSREIHPPDNELIEMMTSIGIQISQFIERRQAQKELRSQEENRRIAREIQQGLLPKTMPTLRGFTICGRSSFADEVGGDCFDFIPAFVGDREYLDVLIADASGHGIGAALLMAETQAYLRALALTCANVETLLALTNRRLVEDLITPHFVTLLLIRLDPTNRSLLYTHAGHCPGYVLNHLGRTKAVLTSQDLPLGIMSTSQFSTGPTISLESGDLVFLFTDGIIEAQSSDDDHFGMERALDLVRRHQQESPDEILEALFGAVSDFSGHRLQDDLTAVIIKVEGAG
jgi:PAS domain S-box-containing protein